MAPADEGVGATHATSAGAPAWLLWGGLVLAFSPVLMDLARHLSMRPQLAYLPFVAALFVWGAMRQPCGARRPGLGYALLLGAVALELVFAKIGWLRFARPGFAVGLVAVSLLLGRSHPLLLVLALLAVPLPSFVVDSLGLSPGAFAQPLVAAVNAAGAELELTPGKLMARVSGPAGHVDVTRYDTGLPLVPWIAALCVGGAIRRDAALRATLLRSSLLGLLAFPIQAAAVGAACAGVAIGAEGVARAWLAVGVWITTAIGFGWIEFRRNAGG